MPYLKNSSRRVTSVLSAFALLLTVSAAHADGPVTEEGAKGKVAPAAPRWVPKWLKMPLLSPEAAKAGVFPGGEGAQWPRGPVAISPADPDFLLLPIDVGGLYRSLDGGKNWEIAMVGWNARGANVFAHDPKNSRRVIGIAGNSMDWGADWGGGVPNGIYLTTDKAASWKQVAAFRSGFATMAVFDPTSYDAAKKYCTTAYVAAPGAGLLKTGDGGATWQIINPAPPGMERPGYHPTRMAAHPTKGWIYIGGRDGVFESKNGGKSFDKIYPGDACSVVVSAASPDSLWVSGADGIAVSIDGGKSFSALPATGIDRLNNKPIQCLAISPVDPNLMACWIEGDAFNWTRYSSQDGGKTFAPIKIEKGLAPLPLNVRNGFFAYHPKLASVVYGIGGDWVTRSEDGGKTFQWRNNGYSGVMTGGMFNFSPHEPNTVFIGFQDYNGAFTTDGGKTWNYRDVSGKGWGGYCYGGFAPDKNVMFTGDADGWGAPRALRISRDGGATWNPVPGPDGKPQFLSGPDVSLCDPTDKNILFAHNLRSTDKGEIWAKMMGCEGVFTFNPRTKSLFGKMGNVLVGSDDKGATWQSVSDVPGGIDDIGVDGVKGRIYVASQERLKRFADGKWETLETPKDQYGNIRVTTVAVDPKDPNVVYVGGPRNTYASQATICRTTDGGATWQNLTVLTPLGNGVTDGPHEVGAIRVHPVTREAWAAGQCYGLWRIAPPAPGTKGVPAEEASAPRAPDLKTIVATAPPTRTLSVRNGDMEAGGDKTGDKPDAWDSSWTGSGKIIITRDTSVFHGGKASLKVASDGGAAMGQAGQIQDAEPGAKFTVSGWVRSKGSVKVNVGVQPADINGMPITFLQAGYVQNDSEWTHFQKEIVLPDKTARFGVTLLLEGDGAAYLDDVTLEGSTPVDPALAPPPASQEPTIGFPGYFPEYPQGWLNYHKTLLDRAKKNPTAPLVFIGDSITQGWTDGGKTEWGKNFVPLGAIDLGIGGDKTSQILWRVQHGTLDGLSPKLIVLAIGVNNLWRGDFDNAKVAEGIAACVTAIREKCPKSKLLVIGLFPTQETADNPLRARVKEINALTAKRYADKKEKNARFVDFGDKFLSSNGSISKEIMPDFLHPNAKGYVIYADNLAPIVREMIK